MAVSLGDNVDRCQAFHGQRFEMPRRRRQIGGRPTLELDGKRGLSRVAPQQRPETRGQRIAKLACRDHCECLRLAVFKAVAKIGQEIGSVFCGVMSLAGNRRDQAVRGDNAVDVEARHDHVEGTIGCDNEGIGRQNRPQPMDRRIAAALGGAIDGVDQGMPADRQRKGIRGFPIVFEPH